jgi:hypothetical protein
MAVDEIDIVSKSVSGFSVKAENAHYNGLRLKQKGHTLLFNGSWISSLPHM